MPPRQPWWSGRQDGVLHVRLKRWTDFEGFVTTQLAAHPAYIYRGHTSSKWRLEPTLDRLLRKIGKAADPPTRQAHLDRFRMALRGRRGTNPVALAKPEELWAIGQHYGLATPLLDWTWSPYVAAYFAFADVIEPDVKYRTVFGLHTQSVEQRSKQVTETHVGTGAPPALRRIEPLLDENVRLVSQGGLFTWGPDGVDVDSWVRAHFAGDRGAILVRVDIPSSDRALCLRSLNRMNINHLSLFPEVFGSARYCNYWLEIDSY